MRHLQIALFPILLGCAILASCGFSKLTITEFPRETVVIVDDDGEEWDITSAIYDYGMRVDGFHHGIGKNAIPPLLAPPLLSISDDGFPEPTESFPVVGTRVGSDVRAYGIWDIAPFEVVDEVIGDTPVAVAY